MSNYYDVLGLSPEASETDIKKAYRQLSFKYHPDRCSDPQAQSKFQAINEAYETLKDAGKRREYDLRDGGPSDDDLTNILNMMFSGVGGLGGLGGISGISGLGGNRGSGIRSGRIPIHVFSQFDEIPTLTVQLFLTMEQCYTGCTVPVEVERIITYHENKEKETIYVDVPPGIDHNEYIRIGERGHIINNKKQDLKILIQCIPHDSFRRNGLELLLKKNITLKEALLGTTITFQHLNGKTYNLNSSPEIIGPGVRKRFVGLGMVRQNTIGDMYIEFNVMFPHTLTEEQRALIEQL